MFRAYAKTIGGDTLGGLLISDAKNRRVQAGEVRDYIKGVRNHKSEQLF